MHLEILSEPQRLLLPFVQSLSKEFYLVGGTAIALHIGHRQSIDFVDLYFIFRDHFSLDAVVKKAESLFSGLFSPKLFRQYLCYFDDVDYTEEVSFMTDQTVTEDEVKEFLTNIATLAL